VNADITLLIVILLLTVFFIHKKTHVAFVTLALFGGYTLSDKASYLLAQNAGAWINDSGLPVYTIIRLILLFGPPLMVAYHFRHTQTGSSRLLEQLVPAFSLTLLIAVFVVEQLNYTTRASVLDNSIALNQLWIYTPWVVVFSLGSALFDIMLRKPSDKKKTKK